MAAYNSFILKSVYISLFYVCLVGLPLPTFAAQPEKCDYAEFQRLPLFKDTHGINGFLVVMRNRKLLFQAFAVGNPEEQTKCNARLDIIDKNNQRIFKQFLAKPIASLEKIKLLGLQPKSFALYEDYGIGAGSYAGPVSSFFDVVDGKIKWLQFQQSKSKKTEKISVMSSLKTGWEIVRNGENFDILEAACRPEFSIKLDEPAFSLTYSRYHYNGNEWIKYSRKVDGYWDFEGAFPDYSLFPNAQ
jgi:hypothetical protein